MKLLFTEVGLPKNHNDLQDDHVRAKSNIL